MHTLIDIINRLNRPQPWSEGEKIPWNEPGFSQRMLIEHLTQEHDLASRRSVRIDQQVAWIHGQLLKNQPGRILDLGCGPGLYAQRLHRLGHTVTGIDFSPASIAYARGQAEANHSDITYREADIRFSEYGEGFDLVMLIYGEFNTFKAADAALLLDKAYAALLAGGMLLLEPHTFNAVKHVGESPPSWYSSNNGLFSDRPHMVLGENFWDPDNLAAVERYYIIDAVTGEVTQHASSMQAYDENSYRLLLADHQFKDIKLFPSLMGSFDESSNDLIAIVAIK